MFRSGGRSNGELDIYVRFMPLHIGLVIRTLHWLLLLLLLLLLLRRSITLTTVTGRLHAYFHPSRTPSTEMSVTYI